MSGMLKSLKRAQKMFGETQALIEGSSPKCVTVFNNNAVFNNNNNNNNAVYSIPGKGKRKHDRILN